MDSGFFAELVIGPAEGRTRWRNPGMTPSYAWCSAMSPSVDVAGLSAGCDFG
jgi:hypothetical protein